MQSSRVTHCKKLPDMILIMYLVTGFHASTETEVCVMAAPRIQIQMFGAFSLRTEDAWIDDSANRSHKVWLLLAYLIYHRHRTVTQEELIDLLWGEDNDSANPLGALKTTLHRVRTTLDQLFPSAGHDLIVRKNGAYAWTSEIETEVDITLFEELRRAAVEAPDDDTRLETYLDALSLYSGDFLNKLSSKAWVVPISAYYHNLYIQAVLDTLPLLESRNRNLDAADLCRVALQVSPYHETLYQHLMQNLLELDDQKGAVAAYEEMCEVLLTNLGVMPSEESRALYRDAVKTVNDRVIHPSTLREQLKEHSPASGALICDYDFFKLLYQAEARSVSRSGDAVHIGLLSMTGENNTELPRRSLSCAMENLQEQIRNNLRRGDSASRCSASQYILLLPHANYENSCMVCERIIRAFSRQYPHSPAELHYSVQPLEPTL